ncbi:MAG TPA: RNase adapter RapZ [Terriglobia bacterium]|nr:RNase adapter RapZ [Terriglobia bacterium]
MLHLLSGVFSGYSMESLRRLFIDHFGSPPNRVDPLKGPLGGSERQLFRLIGAPGSAIGVHYPSLHENVAFLEFSRHFRRHGLPVPEIFTEDLDRNVYLEEDLGDTTLFQYLAGHRDGERIAPEGVEAYRKVVALLPRFQVDAGRDLDYSVCYPRQSFDRQSITWDLNYFKYYFLRAAGIPFNEQALEDDFVRLTDFLLTAPGSDFFLYRDFQSRNIMWRDGKPYFLDYQGGRRGAPHYDIASLLYDAKADLPPELRERLLEEYVGHLSSRTDIGPTAFMRHYYAFVYIRIMQAMGAYGFRGFFERKPLFLASVPYALRNVRWLLDHVELPVETPTLMTAFRSLLDSERFAPEPPADGKQEILTVRVFSFSFLHGNRPQDDTGNGGGFVFDVRSLPNPGREERFKKLTGKDAAVIEYLERSDDVRQYFANVCGLVDASVRNYRQRGFRNLMVSFGCTGGQHRSVYMAEQLAQHLNAIPGVRARVAHLQLEVLDL